jgi:hypothetical protein
MIKVRAQIELYKGWNKRNTPFITGYRPLFQFGDEMKTSGQITLIGQEKFTPGEKGIVEISFLHKEYLGKLFRAGTSFKFFESNEALGEGKIIHLL